MTNKDFAIAVNKFFYYALNYPLVEVEYSTLFNGNVMEYLPSFFKAFEPHEIEHFVGKWKSAYQRSGCYGAVNDFYGELDGTHRVKILEYINETYSQQDDFGLVFSNK